MQKSKYNVASHNSGFEVNMNKQTDSCFYCANQILVRSYLTEDKTLLCCNSMNIFLTQ